MRKIWKNKWKILEGLLNNIVLFFSPKKRKIIKQRREICSICSHYDKEGKGEAVVIQGKPACGICGCNIKILTACLSCECSMVDIGEDPHWGAVKNG